MLKIIITGPESSGKTTLCKILANHFKIPFSEEYARKYLAKLDRKYTQKDLIKIAKKQLQFEQDKRILDTDLITIKIWSNYKYGNCEKWILEQIQKQKSKQRFYLLCKPDIKWEKDTLRENPKNRMDLFQLYKKELENLNHKHYILEGERKHKNIISKILDQKFII
tara:strand:+ start:10309 stop:10806 length:498 start_codon:yes stop_codon:yes gene_type:complete